MSREEKPLYRGDKALAELRRLYNKQELRDYFAAAALPYCIGRAAIDPGAQSMEIAAKNAYKAADAMLEARKEGGDE